MSNLFFIPGFATTAEICHSLDPQPTTFLPTQHLPSDSIIIGWSIGALDAVKLYLHHKEKIKALVLVSAFPKFLKSKDYPFGLPPALLRKLENKIKVDLVGGIEYFYSLLPANPKHQAPNSKQILMPKYQNLNKEKILRDLERLKTENIRHLLPKIEVPVLIIHGDRDQIVPVESAKYLHQQIPASELVVFKNVGHAPFLEDPSHFNKHLRGFLSKYA